MDRRSKIELVVVGLFTAAIGVIIVGCMIRPELFWDRLVWKYFWGPIEADAQTGAGTKTEYNWISTLTYGLLLVISAYTIYRVIAKVGIRVGDATVLSTLPVLIIGPAARVLEDMELFREPLQYLFISPLIYMFIGYLTVLVALAAHVIEVRPVKWKTAQWLFLMIPGLFISLIISMFPGWFSQEISFLPILGTSLVVPALSFFLIKRKDWEWTAGIFWFQVLIVVVYFYILWAMKGEWYEGYVREFGRPELELWAGIGIIILALAVTGAIFGLLYLFSRKVEDGVVMLTSVNFLVIGSHMLDATATFVGIDFFGYVEKHVVPRTLMDWASSTGFPYGGTVMYPLKLAFLLPALYYMDVRMKEETRSYPHLMALVKLIIIVLGIGPGIRDVARIALGV
ncbi:MAG: DUF63 family protein [Thermoplasmatota archaeon]